MDVSHILNNLNKAQREAVSAKNIHTLVLAGAGSGKTRVLTYRIAWLLETTLCPHNILAVTFTNRAANEMRIRIERLLRTLQPSLWTGTFHGIAHRLLRIHWQEAGLPQNFQILDSDDQERLVKRVIRSLQLDEKAWIPKQAQYFINDKKERGLRPYQFIAADDWSNQMNVIYASYQMQCERSGVVDFSELLLRTYEMFRQNSALLEQYHQRFKCILVDEFQDTNTIQYDWLKLLAGEQGQLFAVGDDDQSIYSFRGARIENILNFQRDFKNSQLIRLEQNYRSTGTILEVANSLIAHNKGRLGKQLWTEGKAGEPVYLYRAYNEINEAEFITERIQAWEGKLSDIAILYRTSAQSRIFEEKLLEKNIPYRIYGGWRFYERSEIKDVIAYLTLIMQHHNDSAFERTVNLPKRGIGDSTMEKVRGIARQQGCSLWQATAFFVSTGSAKSKAVGSLANFLHLIEQLAEEIRSLPLEQQVKQVINSLQLKEHYLKSNQEEGQRRIENLDELIVAAHQFTYSNKDDLEPIIAFLAHAALEAGEQQSDETVDHVQLMTLHLAKGLEFEVVFLCGLEEGLFPHENSLGGNVEEERRLCYVGITRARRYLYLSHSESRYHYGQRTYNRPSRFLQELSMELVQEVQLRSISAKRLISHFV